MEFEFDKNGEVETIDKVPAEFRGFYAQDPATNKFKITEIGLAAGKAVDGLNRSLKASRRDADEARKGKVDLTPFKEIGKLVGIEDDAQAADPTALRGAIERVIAESKDGKVNWEKLKTTLEQGFNTKLQAKDAELQGMSKSLQKYLVTSAAVSAIAASKGVPELLLPHIQSQTKVVKEGEDYVVRVVDASGDPRGNASGGFMTVEDLVKEMKSSPTFGRAFESEASQGSGFKPGSGNTRPTNQQTTVHGVDRIKKGLEARRR